MDEPSSDVCLENTPTPTSFYVARLHPSSNVILSCKIAKGCHINIQRKCANMLMTLSAIPSNKPLDTCCLTHPRGMVQMTSLSRLKTTCNELFTNAASLAEKSLCDTSIVQKLQSSVVTTMMSTVMLN